MHPLAQKVSSLRRQLVLRQRAAAACWTAATVLAAAIALGTADYLVRFADPGFRIMATIALVSATLWAVYRWWYVPSRNQLAPLAVARRVEAHFPQLRDMLASSMEFLQQSEDDRTAGSTQLRRLVVAEAQSAVERLPLDDVIDRGPLRRAVKWLAAPVIVLMVILAFDASAVGTAVTRLVAPLGSTQWPRTNHLAFRNVPKRMAAGQTFEVELIDTAGPLPDDVRIEYRMADRASREPTKEPMTRAGEVMLARRENVRQSFAFRAVGGDDHTMPWHWVDVVEPPRLEAFSVIAHPPAYTGLPSASAEGHLEVLAGSGLEVRGASNKSLSAARILIGSSSPIAATIGADNTGDGQRTFRVSSEQWIASESGPYRVELSAADGIASVVGQWNLRLLPDQPPSVSWTRPAEDLYVTAAAIVPIEVSVTDNLAIERAELLFEHSGARSDVETNQGPRESTESRIDIYRGPPKPVVNNERGAGVPEAESRNVKYQWNLASLQLPVGTQLNCQIEAADYRPGTGRTAAPRRITIISTDELNDRLADHQARIVRQLERALAAQRTTREDVRRLEIQRQGSLALANGDRVALQTAELNQPQVGQSLVDQTTGVLGSVNSLIGEIEINQVSASDFRVVMERVLAELDRLSRGPLNVAESELVAARKSVEGWATRSSGAGESAPVDDAQSQHLAESLAAAGNAQDSVVASLERLISELSGSTDVRRLAQWVAELRRDQVAHEQIVRAEIGLDTLPLQLNELSRAQRGKLDKAAAGQSALVTRFENIVQAIDHLAQEQSAQDEAAADAAAHAVDLARRLAIATNMQETSRDLSGNRVGQALAREAQIAADLQQVLDALDKNGIRRPDQLVNQLRQAEERLAELREQVAALRRRIAQEEQRATTASNSQQLSQLAGSQQTLQRETEQLAGQLKRLQAADASESTQHAANRLANASGNEDRENTDGQQPASSSEVQQAEQDLEQAAQQLANERQQAENELALEFVRRFQAELGTMVDRQKKVIHDTVQLDAARKSDSSPAESISQRASKLAVEERWLANLAGEQGELLSGLGAVRMGLDEAERRLAAAAALLDGRDTGPRAQQAERHALARLEGMLQAFAQTTSESAAGQASPAGNSANPPGQPPQRRPTFELLEVKMLRMLQVDVNDRTQVVENQLAGLKSPIEEPERAELAREAQELQAQQRRLAELVQEMLTRDNGEGGQ